MYLLLMIKQIQFSLILINHQFKKHQQKIFVDFIYFHLKLN